MSEDHVNLGLRRIGHQYAHSEKFWQFVAATTAPLNDIEAAFLSLLDIDLDTAEGVVLELLGRIVGAPAIIENAVPLPYFGFTDQENSLGFGEIDDPAAGGYFREWDEPNYGTLTLDEAAYQLTITAQIIRNSSDCTPDDIIRVIKLISDKPFDYQEQAMTVIIQPTVTNFSVTEQIMMRLFAPRGAGITLSIRDVNGAASETD